jgi:hypothetical protein
VRRRDDAHVHLHGRGAADALERALLEDPQQLDLCLQRKVADLVEEERPPVGQLDATGLATRGAREGALLVSEQLALEQGVGQRRAVDRDEGTGAPGRLPVDRARRDLPSSSSTSRAAEDTVAVVVVARVVSLVRPSACRAACIAFSTTKTICSRSNGLSTKSAAPARIASTARGTVPCAVRTTTGNPGQRAAMVARSCIPSMPGIRRSVSTTLACSSASVRSAASALGTCEAVIPACWSSATSTVPTATSSSTTSTEPFESATARPSPLRPF